MGGRADRAVGLHRHRPHDLGRGLDQRQAMGPTRRHARHRRGLERHCRRAPAVLQPPRPGPEQILEAYYSYALSAATKLSLDYQFIVNPGYNTDRGPVNVFSDL